ncbi:MAG: dTDP-4-dehydrorhamnose 3,5-epimerase [bacterium]
MKVIKTHISGPLIIESQVFTDKRGYFFEEYNFRKYKEIGISESFVQDNASMSVKNVIRGLHIQLEPMAQGKLAMVVKGKVLDVAVDCRLESLTYGQYVSVILSEENKKQFWIPRGFAHGFSVLSEEAIFSYKCDNYYSKDYEFAIVYNDLDLRIDWQVEAPLVSEKDSKGLMFSDLKDVLLKF